MRRKAKGATLNGFRFEKAVGDILAAQGFMPRREQWFEFRDHHGRGLCQTDLLIFTDDLILVVECKLTARWSSWRELSSLYLPVVKEAYGMPAFGLLACKNVGPHLKPDRFIDAKGAIAEPHKGESVWLLR